MRVLGRVEAMGGWCLLTALLASPAGAQAPQVAVPGGFAPPFAATAAPGPVPSSGAAPLPFPTHAAYPAAPTYQGAAPYDRTPAYESPVATAHPGAEPQAGPVPQPIALTAARQPVGGPDLSPVYPPQATQEAPGPLEYDSPFDRESDPVPDYVYEPSYYNSYYDEVHQLADYAPPGYEARDYQSAPGDPEYRRITPPVRVMQEERESFVVGGMVPGSFLAPGTNTSFRLRGFVRLAALSDLQPIGVRDAFVVNSIPVPQTAGQNFNMSGRISRFALETWTPTTWCERTIHTFIEGDFFNGADQAAGGGGNPFRLRHAFFDVGWFRFGQQNSVFMDGTNWPSLVDFQGPNGWTNQRQPLARMTVPVFDGFYWASSIERPFSNISTNGLGDQVQDVPDFASHLRWERDRGHLQLAGIVRTLGYRPTGGNVTRLTGAGLSGNAVFHPWAFVLGTNPVRERDPSGLTRSRILLQGTWGPGVGRYINDLSGQGVDGQVDPVTGDFDAVVAGGWNASYEHWFNAYWLTNLTYSQVTVDSRENQPAATYDAGQYVAASLWWIPITRLSLGMEYLWGERENLNGQSAEAQRIHWLAQYNF